MTDAVVWNPGQAPCASMNDLPEGDFDPFLCIEAAAVRRPLHLPAQHQWTGSQTLLVL